MKLLIAGIVLGAVPVVIFFAVVIAHLILKCVAAQRAAATQKESTVKAPEQTERQITIRGIPAPRAYTAYTDDAPRI